MKINNHKAKCLRKRGFGLIEMLVAGCILAISVTGLISFGYVNFTMTSRATNMTGASAAGRSEIERVRLQGFTNAAEGSSTDYYDANGTYPGSITQTSSSVYSVTTIITSDSLIGGVPATGALRTVRSLVTLISTGQVVYETDTALASQGV